MIYFLLSILSISLPLLSLVYALVMIFSGVPPPPSGDVLSWMNYPGQPYAFARPEFKPPPSDHMARRLIVLSVCVLLVGLGVGVYFLLTQTVLSSHGSTTLNQNPQVTATPISQYCHIHTFTLYRHACPMALPVMAVGGSACYISIPLLRYVVRLYLWLR